MAQTNKLPALHLGTSNNDDRSSSIFSFNQYSKDIGDVEDVSLGGHTRIGDHLERSHYGRTYLPPLSELSDQDSIYSQDSACVVYTSQLRPVANPTPKSTLTFAAIWDPDYGMSTFSGKQLVGQEGSSENTKDDKLSDWIQDENHDYLPAFYGSGHPDCEPHLASRFSTTTTSTSNYIDIDFNEQDQINLSKSIEDDLLPGDLHPAWVPQIFSVGYTKPQSCDHGPKRPEISEPLPLAPMIRRDELPTSTPMRPNTSPARIRLSPGSKSPSSSSTSLFSLSRSYSSASHKTTASSRKYAESNTHSSSSSTSSLRRGFSFSSRSHHSRSQSNSATATSVEDDAESFIPPMADGAHTPTRRPTMNSVFGKLKSPSPKKGLSEAWVIVDVEVRPTIHQRVVEETE